MKQRCEWGTMSPLMVKYHDREWGKPVHDDRKLFEALLLDSFQAGLSWSTILNKRENFRRAFDNFDVEKISRYTARKKALLMNDAGIIRNRLKIEAAVQNARGFLAIQKEFGSFNKYIWGFVNNKPIVNKFKHLSSLPTNTLLSEAISKDLKKRGFNFVGATCIYAFMQGVGMVNDHTTMCFRYKELK